MSEIQQLLDENNMGFGAEETNSLLDHPNLAAAMKKLLELQLQVMVIPIVKRIVGPMMENMVRKVVKEEFERAQERFFAREKWKSRDEGHLTQVQQLELQFLDNVSGSVYTGKEIKGGGGNHLTVALVDPLTRSRVLSGPAASAKVEIIVLVKDDDDDMDRNFRHEESQDTGRPLLSQNHVTLKEGIAILDNIKFRNRKRWTKCCKVSLVARIANLNGITVKEAATEPFPVMDWRNTLYKKHYPPSLSDDVWRLENIRRGSQLHKHLIDANINTVEEFLRLLNMDPQSLKAVITKLKVSDEKFKVMVDHAQTCQIGENLYLYNSKSCQRKAGAVFNIVGCLQGLLYEEKYVPVDKLSEDEKVDAHKIIVSAFEHLDDAESIGNEASIAHLVSRSSNANGADTSSSPRTESAAGSNVSHKIVVSTFEDLEDVEPIENEASISHFTSPSSNANGADTSSSPRTESAAGSNVSHKIVESTFEDLQDVEPIENETSISHLTSRPSHANGADTSSSPRTENAAGSNFGNWKTIGECDNALPSTVPRHFSRICSFDYGFLDGFDFFPANNTDILSYGTNYPIPSRTASEDSGELWQFFIEQHPDQRATAGDSQMTSTSVATPSSIARRRGQMALGKSIMASGDMQARKKQRLK